MPLTPETITDADRNGLVLAKDPVVYQIYPRSYQDSNGDGIGDLPGITSRLGHLQRLGVDAIWLSPIFKSPMADFGYDVSDYCDIAPEFGTLADAEQLIEEAHRHDIAVVLDMILAHTSIEHPWFRSRPDFYIRADRPMNNWLSVFGGSMWSKDPHGDDYYLHRFYPEQPDLDWRNPEVRQAMYEVMNFWCDRGVDGFRLDALDGLYKREDFEDMPPAIAPYPLPVTDLEAQKQWRQGYDSNLPEVFDELALLRMAFPDTWFVAEALRVAPELGEYTQHLDAAINFEFLFMSMDPESIAEVLRRSTNASCAWVLSNHDFSRLVTRSGPDLARMAAVLLLTLPGTALVYQGDEIGMTDGPGALGVPYDAQGRDPFRHPMQWNVDGGFTTGSPWLPLSNPAQCNVEDQDFDDRSMLHFYRTLIEFRKTLTGPLRNIEVQGGVLTYERDNAKVVCNFGSDPIAVEGKVLMSTQVESDVLLRADQAMIVAVQSMDDR